jgi:hypothetical protein
VPIPDIPKAIIDERDSLIAIIARGCETSAELFLGTSSARVATSALEQTTMRASVCHWRQLLSRAATKMYWRLFGEATLKPVFDAAIRNDVAITPEMAQQTVMDTSVVFTFRSEILTPEITVMLWRQGILTFHEVQSQLMSAYGLPESAFQQPQLSMMAPQPGGGGGSDGASGSGSMNNPQFDDPFPQSRRYPGAVPSDPNIPIGFSK